MRRFTIEVSNEDAIALEAAAKYMHFGCRAEDMIQRAIRDALTAFEAERERRIKMDNAEKELELAMFAYVRDGVYEFLGTQAHAE